VQGCIIKYTIPPHSYTLVSLSSALLPACTFPYQGDAKVRNGAFYGITRNHIISMAACLSSAFSHACMRQPWNLQLTISVWIFFCCRILCQNTWGLGLHNYTYLFAESGLDVTVIPVQRCQVPFPTNE
jgi:hypothetical protein